MGFPHSGSRAQKIGCCGLPALFSLFWGIFENPKQGTQILLESSRLSGPGAEQQDWDRLGKAGAEQCMLCTVSPSPTLSLGQHPPSPSGSCGTVGTAARTPGTGLVLAPPCSTPHLLRWSWCSWCPGERALRPARPWHLHDCWHLQASPFPPGILLNVSRPLPALMFSSPS